MRHFLILTGLFIALLAPAMAQESNGQVCLRAFEDRNANGVYDSNEPFITRDISVTLANVDGVTVESALLDNSIRATLGLVCFQGLEAGQYTLTALSATYAPTSLFAFVASVSETSVPQVFDYGAQVIVTAPPTPPAQEGILNVRALVPRLLFSMGGAFVIIVGMIMLGVVAYFLFLRNTGTATPAYAGTPPLRPDTGTYRPVHDTGSYRAAPPQEEARYRPPNPQLDDLPPAGDDDTGKHAPQG